MSTNPTNITTEPGTPFIDIERVLDAKPAFVFRAFTEPELVKQWLGPRSLTMKIDEYDAKTGGRYRYVHVDDDGEEYRFQGVFHRVADDHIIQTFEFEGAPGQVAIETMSIDDAGGGRTRLRAHSVYPSVEARDGMAQSGMEEGVNDGYERIEELSARLDT